MKIMFIVAVITQMSGILLYFPVTRPILEGVGFYKGTVYHQRAGHSIVFMLPFLLLSLKHTLNKMKKLILYLITITLLTVSITTGARIPSVISILMLLFWERKPKKMVIALVISIAVITAAVNLTESDIFVERYDRIFSLVREKDVEQAENVAFRVRHLVYGMRAFSNTPFFGGGYGHWQERVGIELGTIGYVWAAHNEPLRILVEYGLVGFILYFLSVWFSIRQFNFSLSDSLIRNIEYCIFFGVIFQILLNTFHNALFSRSFFFLLASGAGLTIRKKYFSEAYGEDDESNEQTNLKKDTDFASEEKKI